MCPDCAVTYVAVHILKIQSIIIKFVTFYENGKLMKLIGSERAFSSPRISLHFFFFAMSIKKNIINPESPGNPGLLEKMQTLGTISTSPTDFDSEKW